MDVTDSVAVRVRRRRLVIVFAVVAVGVLSLGGLFALAVAVGRSMASSATVSAPAVSTALNRTEAGLTVCRPQVILSVANDQAMRDAARVVVTLDEVGAVNPQGSLHVWMWYQSWRTGADPNRRALAELSHIDQKRPDEVGAVVAMLPKPGVSLQTLADKVRSRLAVAPETVEVGRPCEAERGSSSASVAPSRR